MNARNPLAIVVAVIFVLVLAGCGGTGGDTLGSSPDEDSTQAEELGVPDEGDIETPDSASAELYGAVEKFNEFSISFMARMRWGIWDSACPRPSTAASRI